MQSIIRMMKIIETLSQNNKKGLTITEFTQQTDIALSTLHRMLSSLLTQRLVNIDNNSKRYYLGDTWVQYGLQVYDQFDYIAKVRPLMDVLANKINEDVYMYKPFENESMIIERIDSPNKHIQIVDQLGLRIPVPYGAANQVLMTYKIIKEKKSYDCFNDSDLLQRIILKNFAIVKEKDSVTIAAPILSKTGNLKTIISLKIHPLSLIDDREEILINALLNTKKEIESILYY